MDPRDAEDLVRRFEERHAVDSEAEQQQGPAEPTAEQVAEAIGARPEVVELPSAARRAFVLFELEDGSFGSLPVTGLETSVEEAAYLAQRFLFRATVDVTARRLAQVLAAQPGRGRAVSMAAPRNIRSDQ